MGSATGMDATITVGIPTYNRASLLREAIESVLAQSYASFRLIVSDNGSEDDTASVVRSFDDQRIQYVRAQRNTGPLANFNRLIGLAETEYVVLLCDDDIMYPEYLRTVVDLMARHPSVGAVHAAYHRIDESSNVVERITPVRCSGLTVIEPRERVLERLMVASERQVFSTTCRTIAVRSAGGLREEDGLGGDQSLWMRVALDWDFAYASRPLIGVRAHPGTLTTWTATEHSSEEFRFDTFYFHTAQHFERRRSFLDDAQLDPGRERQLRAIATLRFTADHAALISIPETFRRLTRIVRMRPRTLLEPTLWRIVAAQLGGRRAVSALLWTAGRFRAIWSRLRGSKRSSPSAA